VYLADVNPRSRRWQAPEAANWSGMLSESGWWLE
jgi:hypothetical protein